VWVFLLLRRNPLTASPFVFFFCLSFLLLSQRVDRTPDIVVVSSNPRPINSFRLGSFLPVRSFVCVLPSVTGLCGVECAAFPLQRGPCCNQQPGHRFCPPPGQYYPPSPSFLPRLQHLRQPRLAYSLVLAVPSSVLLSPNLPNAIVPTAECVALDAATFRARPMSRAVRSCPLMSSLCTTT